MKVSLRVRQMRKARSLPVEERRVLVECGIFTANELKTGCSDQCEENAVDLITYVAPFVEGTVRLSRCPKCGRNWTRPGPNNKSVRPI